MSGHSENPASNIEALFRDIAATRMVGLPLNNPALSVEAVGFRDWHGVWVGVLITPWAINLMLVPGAAGGVAALGPDEKQRWRFPSGEYEFMGGSDESLGVWQFCSLFSPAFEFDSQDHAREVAEATMAGLMAAEELPETGAEQARLEGKPLLERPLSRRGFLRGVLGGGK